MADQWYIKDFPARSKGIPASDLTQARLECGVDEEETEGSCAYYLAHAARIRAAAERATVPAIRAELLKMAIAFERLAERARHSAR